ncbi:MAG: tubulin-like doman-containing protein, partial [Bacteroidales bacterium]|nr:tubulin-like doman-containing protein [Bacteroidales bacterium]
EENGPGTLQPTLVIGAGFTGLRILQRLRKHLGDRFGAEDRIPAVRTLYIDTDPDALAIATADPAPGLARLRPEDVYAARLNRAQHYLKPRLSGRSLIEGWFDSQLLYRLPRNPMTMGLRVFGRLAFCDHYRPLIQKIQAELEACLAPAAMTTTLGTTGLALRSNRPRVYIAAGLGGGTGSGMFLDLAYTVRARLKRLGYADPEIIGILPVPPDGEQHPQTLANVYASLTELHHYGRAETLFSANYDDRPSLLRDTAPPFRQVYLLPGLPGGLSNTATPPAGSTPTQSPSLSRGSISLSGAMRNAPMNARSSGVWSPSRSGAIGTASALASPEAPPAADRDPCTLGADVIRLDLLTGVGRLIDEAMPARPSDSNLSNVRTLGVIRFGWPRGEVIARTQRVLAHSLVDHWVSPSPDHIRSMIPNWIGERWSAMGLDPGHLEAQFRQVIQNTAQCHVESTITAMTNPLLPKGWLNRLPEPDRVSVVVDQLRRLIGRPSSASSPQHQTEVESALAHFADRLADVAATDARQLFSELFELPDFRPAGTEEAIRQFLAVLDQTSGIFSKQAVTLELASGSAFDLLVGYAHFQRGMRKPSAAEFTDALRRYPETQYQAVIARAQVHVFQYVRSRLIDLLSNVETCRHRVEGLLPLLTAEATVGHHLATQRDLFLLECSSVSESTKRFLEVLNDDDLMALDRRVQVTLQERHGGLLPACMNATDGLADILTIIQETTRAYLDERLGEVDLAGMFWQRYGTPDAIGREMARAFEEAQPALIGPGPWTKNEIAVFVGPTGLGGDPIREVAVAVLPPTILAEETRDEVLLLREYPAVPLAALPQFGPVWAAAYRAAYEIQQTTAHTRVDITRWVDVDSV